MCGGFKMFPESLFSEKYKRVQAFKLHLFQNSPLCNYTLLPVTVKVLEAFMEAIL
jgi:hypothetical protein